MSILNHFGFEFFYRNRKHTYINTLVSSGAMFILMLLSKSVVR